MKKYKITITEAMHGKRIDEVLMHHLAHLSNRRVRSIIDVGGVYLNRKRIRMRNKTVQKADYIEVEYNPAAMQKMNRQQFVIKKEDILYYADGIIAINKPPGLPSQATRDQALVHVVPLVEAYLRSQGEVKPKLTLLHRLDKETSGVILLAKDAKIAAKIFEDFKERRIEKEYHATCYGTPKADKFRVECHLSDIDKKLGVVRKVKSGGKASLTDFNVLSHNNILGLSLIRCKPKTGRSHQIRVHLETEGLPIVGDKRYGGRDKKPLPDHLSQLTSEYHFLHAESITIELPKHKKPLTIRAPYPENFKIFAQKAELN
jgi:RluA family pseudouridine synthase